MQKPSKHSNFQLRFATLEKWRKQNMRVVVSRTASKLNTFGTKNHLSEEAGKSFVPIISDSALTGVSQPLFKDPAERGLVCLEFEPTTSRMERPQCISFLLCVHSIRLLKPRTALKIIKQLHVRQTNRIIDHSLWENVVS